MAAPFRLTSKPPCDVSPKDTEEDLQLVQQDDLRRAQFGPSTFFSLTQLNPPTQAQAQTQPQSLAGQIAPLFGGAPTFDWQNQAFRPFYYYRK